MNKFIPIILAILVSVVSCAPFINTSGIPNLPDMRNKFGEESERILVLPIWIAPPTLAAERQLNNIFTFSEPLFLTVKDLPNLHNIVPSKFSVSLVGIANSLERMIFINGVVIISETGKIVTISCPEKIWEYARYQGYRVACINEKWRDNLIRLFEKSKGEISSPHPEILGLVVIHHEMYFKITNNYKDKQAIINFLNEIKKFCKLKNEKGSSPESLSLIYFNYGITSGLDDKAIEYFTKAINLDLNYADAYAKRGQRYAKIGQTKKSFEDINKAIELNPLDDASFNFRGKLYLKNKLYREAFDDFNTAIEINPTQFLAYINLGHIYIAQQDKDLALESINKALLINPYHTEGYMLRGSIYAEKGKYSKAIADFSKVIKFNPSHAPAYSMKSWILATCPDIQYRAGTLAYNLAKRAVRLSGSSASLKSVAASYAELGDFVKAVEAQEEAIEQLKKEEERNQNITQFTIQLESYKAQKPWRDHNRQNRK